jgi:DNA-binding response OmpR family regulator
MAEVLVVEDDRVIAELLMHLLRREGHAVTHLADGDAAFRHIGSGAPPALVLLDAVLPYRDGASLLAEMRRRDTWRAVPVVMLTGRSLERDVVQALEAGATDYVTKPFQPQELLARIRRLLRPAAGS